MSWLLFLDESGHDHKTMPYEVRGGIALHASKLWPFVQTMQRLELDCFGCDLSLYRKELKGSTLLNKKRYKFATQSEEMQPEARRKHCRAFLAKGLQKNATFHRDEFTAYGQACLEMARGIFQSLRNHEAKLFATAIPRDVKKPTTSEAAEYLRKDHVFLFERFFYFLEEQADHGLLVMDEVEKVEDKRFVRKLHSYFRKTVKGRERTKWIVPSPMFVSSEMTYPVQAADLAIYCLNWGFRLPSLGMNGPVRSKIANEFGPLLLQLQFCGITMREGREFPSFGITFVPDPYNTARK